MDIRPYKRPYFSAFAITNRLNPRKLRRAIFTAFACYAEFCKNLLQCQQHWMGEVLDCGSAKAIEDAPLEFHIAPCLHGPQSDEWEVLPSRQTPAFIYMSYGRMKWFVRNGCIAPPGDPVLACMIPPYANDISLKEIARAHDQVCPGSYTTTASVEWFVAIQLSSRFAEERSCKVRARNNSDRTCRFSRRPGDLSSQYDIVAIGPVSFYDELSRAAISDRPACCLDMLCDYEVFLEESEVHDGIGRYPKCAPLLSVAIVGGGLSGFVAAAELLRSGITDITLFGSCDEVRNIGVLPMQHDEVLHLLNSFGVMPFSANHICLSYYLDKFRMVSDVRFPRAGKDHAVLYYGGECHKWPAGEAPPSIFQRSYAGWKALLCEGCERNGKQLIAPMKIACMLKEQRFDEAYNAWWAWLKEFDQLTFHAALKEIFTGGAPAPGGERWQEPGDFELFGMLRFGFGRASFCYHRLRFTKILEWTINGYEEDQQLIIGGLRVLQARMRSEIFQKSQAAARMCSDPVHEICQEKGKFKIFLKNDQSHLFDRVITSGNNGKMYIFPHSAGNQTAFSDDIPQVIGNSPAGITSGLLIVTKDWFWTGTNFPVVVWTKEVVRELYCFEVESLQGLGLVLLRYASKDDPCLQTQTDDKKQRCLALVRELAAVFPDFAEHLVPLNGDYDQYVFHHHPADDPGSIPSKLSLSYDENLRNKILDANRAGDRGIGVAESDYFFTGAWGEDDIQAGLKLACSMVQSTGGTLARFNPLDCPLSR